MNRLDDIDDTDDIDPQLDAHVRRTLREVARRVPGDPAGHATRPLGGTGPARRRPTRAVAAAAAVLVGVLGVALVADRNRDGSDMATTPDPGMVPQRLILESWPGELLPDGSVAELPLGDLDPRDLSGRPHALPGGRHVALGLEEVPPEDREATELADLDFHLVVVDADGRVEIDRVVPRDGGEDIHLQAASSTEAILVRTPADREGTVTGPSRLVAHDLETGDERLIDEDLPPMVGSVTGDTLAVAQVPDQLAAGMTSNGTATGSLGYTCPLGLIDPARTVTTPREVARPLCFEPRGVRLSPGGDLLAFAYVPVADPDAPSELRLAVFDVADGTVRSNEVIGCLAPACDSDGPVDYLGMAWEDHSTVQVALVDLAAEPGWSGPGHALSEDAVRVETLTVD